jgi:hypothetical protein
MSKPPPETLSRNWLITVSVSLIVYHGIADPDAQQTCALPSFLTFPRS